METRTETPTVASSAQNHLESFLQDEIAAVNALIREHMSSKYAPRISDVTTHLIEAGGKRLRPVLTLAAARLCGYKGTYHIHLAAAVELIHTATLLHDDVVDKSDQRRGRPTANLLWDNKSSILVGDYLFARSFQLMTDAQNVPVMKVLSDASAELAEGEVLQLSIAQNLEATQDTYLQIIRGKTAALFSAAMGISGIISNASEKHTQALFNYGNALGMAFQIADDLLDYSGDQQVLGKNTGDDFQERKVTLPLIKAIAKSNEEEYLFWQRTIEKGEMKPGDFVKALEIMKKYKALDETHADAAKWVRKAHEALDDFPQTPLRESLKNLADYVISRIY